MFKKQKIGDDGIFSLNYVTSPCYLGDSVNVLTIFANFQLLELNYPMNYGKSEISQA